VALVWLGWGEGRGGKGRKEGVLISPSWSACTCSAEAQERHQAPKQMKHGPSSPRGAPSHTAARAN
jgi:hypothetical protein